LRCQLECHGGNGAIGGHHCKIEQSLQGHPAAWVPQRQAAQELTASRGVDEQTQDAARRPQQTRATLEQCDIQKPLPPGGDQTLSAIQLRQKATQRTGSNSKTTDSDWIRAAACSHDSWAAR
jgi:hypothetical protein